MNPRFSSLVSLAALLVSVGLSGNASADELVVGEPELTRSDSRIALHAVGSYVGTSGTEVEDVDSTIGIEGGLSIRVLGPISLYGSYAISSADVEGQLVQLLDQDVRPDGRSGTVLGSVDSSRLRAGIRVDAYRESDFRYRPYLILAAVFSTIDVEVDSVDRVSPPPPVPGPPNTPDADISSFSDDQIGGLVRFGTEVALMEQVSLDLNFSFEILEFPAGTNALTAGGAGISFRL